MLITSDLFLLLLFVLSAACQSTLSWSTNNTFLVNSMVLGRPYLVQWKSTGLSASAKVSIRCFQTSWLVDPKAFDVAVDVPNSGRFLFNSPRTFALTHTSSDKYYLRLESPGVKAVETTLFPIEINKGRVDFDWSATIVAGNRNYTVTNEFASVEAGTVLTLKYVATDVDMSVKYTAVLGQCPDCKCVRKDDDVSSPECGLLTTIGVRSSACTFDPDEYVVRPTPLPVLTPGEAWNYTMPELRQDVCYFFAFVASRAEFSARTLAFKFTKRAIALAQSMIADWPAGDTREIGWTVLENVSPTASLRISLRESSINLFAEDPQLSSAGVFKLRDGKAPFTVPSGIDVKDKVYLQLSIETGEFAGTVVRSSVFKIKPPAVVRPTIRLAGLSLSPRLWPSRSRQRVFFSTAAYTDPVAFPTPATATVTLEDDAAAVEPYSLVVATVPLTQYGSFSVIVPVDAPSSSSMRLKFFEPRQNLTIVSAPFVVAGTYLCKAGASPATATCGHYAGRRVMFSTDSYRLVVETLTVAATAECGGSFALAVTAQAALDRAPTTQTIALTALRTGAAQREQLIVSNDVVLELIVGDVVYDSASGRASMRLRLDDRKLSQTQDIVEYLELLTDVKALQCDPGTMAGQMMPPAAAPAAPTMPPVVSKTQRCVVDDAKCMVMCAPAVLRKCDCDEQGQLTAFCSTRDSADVTATCLPSAQLGMRCDEVCGARSLQQQCACLSDGGSAVSCSPEKCPVAGSLDSECQAACSTFGVQRCTCSPTTGQLSVYCKNQVIPAAAIDTLPPPTGMPDTSAASALSLTAALRLFF
jgi:hypothetical protein